ncbi:MAG: hypothetical protein HY231_06060 [Acidobacteria bacterium]|nr:hypothetical protein [Acidobacteriota bacterium]
MKANAELRMLGESFHHRLISGQDVCVSTEICELLLPLLTKALRQHFANLPDPHLVETFATDALLSYLLHPQKFTPAKSSLLAYLYMDACGDLLNFLERQKKFVELHIPFSEHEMKGIAQLDNPASYQTAAVSALAEQAIAEITDPTDRQIIELMMNAVRETAAYAEALHLENAAPETQKAIVKQHKDWLKARMKRWLKRHDSGQLEAVFRYTKSRKAERDL